MRQAIIISGASGSGKTTLIESILFGRKNKNYVRIENYGVMMERQIRMLMSGKKAYKIKVIVIESLSHYSNFTEIIKIWPNIQFVATTTDKDVPKHKEYIVLKIS